MRGWRSRGLFDPGGINTEDKSPIRRKGASFHFLPRNPGFMSNKTAATPPPLSTTSAWIPNKRRVINDCAVGWAAV
jgi:hypothetical protein